MAVTSYLAIGGEIFGETTGAVQKNFVRDALGSIIAVLDQLNNKTYSARYKPTGTVQLSSGSAPSFTWIGTSGYHQFQGSGCNFFYVRTRNYVSDSGAWTSLDPAWPRESAYVYSLNNPTTRTDPSGMSPCTAIHLGIVREQHKCRIRNVPGGWEIYAYKYVKMQCLIACPRAEHCSCYAPENPDIYQWKTGLVHESPNRQTFKDDDDGSQKCRGPYLIDKKNCLYGLDGMDAPGFIDKYRDVINDCSTPENWSQPGLIEFGRNFLPWSYDMEFTTCCGDPSPGGHFQNCQVMMIWTVSILADSSDVPPGGRWGKCSVI